MFLIRCPSSMIMYFQPKWARCFRSFMQNLIARANDWKCSTARISQLFSSNFFSFLLATMIQDDRNVRCPLLELGDPIAGGTEWRSNQKWSMYTFLSEKSKE
ncbi:hypothetical protein MRB53_038982 [Persea americana]|nr:hypothetical protein MRB53_038982 [Persea americana]